MVVLGILPFGTQWNHKFDSQEVENALCPLSGWGKLGSRNRKKVRLRKNLMATFWCNCGHCSSVSVEKNPFQQKVIDHTTKGGWWLCSELFHSERNEIANSIAKKSRMLFSLGWGKLGSRSRKKARLRKNLIATIWCNCGHSSSVFVEKNCSSKKYNLN